MASFAYANIHSRQAGNLCLASTSGRSHSSFQALQTAFLPVQEHASEIRPTPGLGQSLASGTRKERRRTGKYTLSAYIRQEKCLASLSESLRSISWTHGKEGTFEQYK